MLNVKLIKSITKKSTEDVNTNGPLLRSKDKTDFVKKNQNGGPRPGAGRPKGAMGEERKLELEADAYLKKRVVDSIGELVNSQMNLAKGCQFLFKIETKTFKRGGKTVTERSKPQIVSDLETIEKYLSGELEDNKDDTEYYFMTTERPDNKALDSLLNRTLGRPKETVDFQGKLTVEDLMVKFVDDRAKRIKEMDEDEDDE